MSYEEVRIQRIIDLIANINSGQIAIEPGADSDLGYAMLGYKDSSGNAYKVLVKDEPGRLAYLDFVDNDDSIGDGRLLFDDDTDSFHVGLNSSVDVTLGEDSLIRSYNNSGSEIAKGVAVKISGVNSGVPTIALADKDTVTFSDFVFVTSEDIADSSYGYIARYDHIDSLNLSSFSDNDTLWLDDDGGYQNTQPNAPAVSTKIGSVLSNSATQGILFSDISVVPKITELSDVNRTSGPSDGQGLAWSDSNNRFEFVNLSSGTATLADGAVGFGDSSNELFGDDINFTWDYINRWLLIGVTAPISLSGNDCLYVEGITEHKSTVFFRADVRLYDDELMLFGSPGVSCGMFFNTSHTNECLQLTVDNTSRNFVVTSYDDKGVNCNFSSQTNPTLFLASDSINSDQTQYLSLTHNQADGLLTSGKGSVAFSDEFVAASDWTDTNIPLFNSSAEWSAAYSLLSSSTGSVWALIDAAANSGSSISNLQEAYEGGNTIVSTNSDGLVSISSDASATVPVLTLASGNATTGGDIISINNDNINANAVYFEGSAGDGEEVFGHLLKADGSISILGDFSYNGRAFFNAQKYTGEGTTVYGILRAEDTGSDSGEVKVDSDGNVTVTSTDDIILNSASTIQLDATSYITCQDTSVRDVQNISYNDTLTYVHLFSGVAFINWITGTNIQKIDLDANCTSVSMTNPAGPAELHLIFECDGSSRTFTNFSGTVIWFGDSNPDTTPYAVPANEDVIVKLIFDGTSYRAWVMSQV